MICPEPSRLSAAASGEDLAVEAHTSSCAACRRILLAERSLRSLASHLPPLSLPTDRRRALEATVLALAERAPPARRLGRAPSAPSRFRRATLAATLFAAAAAAVLAWRLAASPARPPTVHAPSPSPTAVISLDDTPPTLTASADARFEHRAHTSHDQIVVTEGSLALDATTTTQPLELVDTSPTPIAVHAAGARLEVRATRGAIHAVQVFAGSVEVTHAGRTIIVTAGATWTPSDLSASRTPDPVPDTRISDTRPPASEHRTPDTRIARQASEDRVADTRGGRDPSEDRVADTRERRDASEDRVADTRGAEPSAFASAWKAWQVGDLGAAAEGFERAARDPALAEDASYWLAATHARAGNSALAIDAYDRFVDAYPSSPHVGAAHLALARLLATTDPARAREHRDRAAADVDPRIRAAAGAVRLR